MLQESLFRIDEPLTVVNFDIDEYSALNYEVASQIKFSDHNNVDRRSTNVQIYTPMQVVKQANFRYGVLNNDFSGVKKKTHIISTGHCTCRSMVLKMEC